MRAYTSESVELWLRKQVGRALKVAPETLDSNRRFMEYGIDSIELTTIGTELGLWLEQELPLTLPWDYPTIATLTQYLVRDLNKGASSGSTEYDPGGIPEAFWRFDLQPAYERVAQRLAQIRAEKLEIPYFRVHDGILREKTQIGGRPLLSFNGFNYLGMSGHPKVTEAAIGAIQAFGTSVSSSRVVGGERPIHRKLEEQLAEFVGFEAALLFVGGHATNVTSIAALLGPRDLVLYDQYAHDSMMQGCRLSGARALPFAHNDPEVLDRILNEKRAQYERVMILVEGVYSADGDVCPLDKIIEVKKRHRAWLFLDEAHSFGTLGRRGRGVIEHFGVEPADIDIWMLTISKALGSTGGVIAGSRALVDLLKYSASGFVNSVGLTPAATAAATAALRLLRAEPERVETLQSRSRYFDRRAREAGLNLGHADPVSPSKPVFVVDDLNCVRLSNRLFERGLDVQAMIPPSVAAGKSRLRFFVTLQHSEADIDQAVQWTAEELKKLQ
jgi:8-amino-7-oxononanoate synthase